MRGEHPPWSANQVASLGIIPACAGSTPSASGRGAVFLGSSPHARGARPWGCTRGRPSWDHPRMRGEHLPSLLLLRLLVGIIPACAGSTVGMAAPVSLEGGSSPHARGARGSDQGGLRGFWDHPRMRGEHDVKGDVTELILRIIPACAGSTDVDYGTTVECRGSSPHARGARWQALSRHARHRDHPRMRGEHQRGAVHVDREVGIIPACAGSTRRCRRPRGSRTGSSPHARGARQCSRDW